MRNSVGLALAILVAASSAAAQEAPLALSLRQAVDVATRENPLLRLAALETATSRIAQWSPGDGRWLPLKEEVNHAFAALAPPTRAIDTTDVAVKRWLAARLFGCWIAYQGKGLQTIVRYLRACLDAFVLELARDRNALEAIRRCDRLIVHDASSQSLATLLDDRT